MMAPALVFSHVLCGVLFFGLMHFSFLIIMKSLRQQDPVLIAHAIKTSLKLDIVLFPMIVVVIVTGAFMTEVRHISPGTAWITAAYGLFSFVSLSWFMLVLIKLRNVMSAVFHYKKLFYALNIIVMILFVLIVHDAVTQTTWLPL